MKFFVNFGAKRLDTEHFFDYLRARVLDREIPAILNLSSDSQKIYATYPWGSWLERFASGRDRIAVVGEYLSQFYRLIKEPFDGRIMGSRPPVSEKVEEPPFPDLEGRTVFTVAWGYNDLDYYHLRR